MKLLASFCILLQTSLLFSQDVEKNLPRDVRSQEPQQLRLQPRNDELSEDNQRVLIQHLDKLVLQSLRSAPTSLESSNVLLCSPDLLISNDETILETLSPFIGNAVTFPIIQDIKQALYRRYRDLGYPVVDISTPEQDITEGHLTLTVIESLAGKITVEGGKYLNKQQKLNAIRQSQGKRIDAETLQKDIDWLNRDPFAGADIVLSPGEQFGESDIILALSDEFPIYGYAGYENTGNRVTSLDRYFIGGSWGNVLNLGHALSYQFTTSGTPEELSIHSADYTIQLPWRDELVISGIYSESRAPLNPFLTEDGQSWYAGVRYWTDLPTINKIDQSLTVGFDFKQTNNDLEFGGISFTSNFDVVQFVASYEASYSDSWGVTEWTTSGYYSPGNLTSNNKDNITTAEADYVYGVLGFSRIHYLPAGFLFFGNISGQLSDSRLFTSEQWGLGGYNTVRGYDYREVNGDEGYVMNLELRTPSMSLKDVFPTFDTKDNTQLLIFWDYGYSRIEDPIPGEIPKTYVASYGVGVRTSITNYFQASIDYGWQLRDIQSPAGNGRLHVSVMASF